MVGFYETQRRQLFCHPAPSPLQYPTVPSTKNGDGHKQTVAMMVSAAAIMVFKNMQEKIHCFLSFFYTKISCPQLSFEMCSRPYGVISS